MVKENKLGKIALTSVQTVTGIASTAAAGFAGYNGVYELMEKSLSQGESVSVASLTFLTVALGLGLAGDCLTGAAKKTYELIGKKDYIIHPVYLSEY